MKKLLCKDCAYCEDDNCLYTQQMGPDPVNGCDMTNTKVHAQLMRLTLCGWDFPRFWKPKERAKDEAH